MSEQLVLPGFPPHREADNRLSLRPSRHLMSPSGCPGWRFNCVARVCSPGRHCPQHDCMFRYICWAITKKLYL